MKQEKSLSCDRLFRNYPAILLSSRIQPGGRFVCFRREGHYLTARKKMAWPLIG